MLNIGRNRRIYQEKGIQYKTRDLGKFLRYRILAATFFLLLHAQDMGSPLHTGMKKKERSAMAETLFRLIKMAIIKMCNSEKNGEKRKNR